MSKSVRPHHFLKRLPGAGKTSAAIVALVVVVSGVAMAIAQHLTGQWHGSGGDLNGLMIMFSMVTGVAVAVTAVLSVAIGRRVGNRLGNDLAVFAEAANRIEQGVLRGDAMERAAQGGKIIKSLSAMESRLHGILSNAKRVASEIQLGTAEISTGNNGLSNRTVQQGNSLERTARSVSELTRSVQQSAENSTRANELAKNASDQAQKGGEAVHEAIEAMNAIEVSSKQVFSIIGVIDDIAFQTNLLALNASVEAARAGDQGRGFAVVANEVRTLAGRSASAAHQIKELIEDSSQKVNSGTHLVRRFGESLEDIVRQVGETTQLVGQICEASQNQATEISDINESLLDMDASTQQNAALVEEAAATSELMSHQARDLSEMLSYFKIDDAPSTVNKADANRKSVVSPAPVAASTPSRHAPGPVRAPSAPARSPVPGPATSASTPPSKPVNPGRDGGAMTPAASASPKSAPPPATGSSLEFEMDGDDGGWVEF